MAVTRDAFQKEGKKGLGRGGSIPWLRDKCTLGWEVKLPCLFCQQLEHTLELREGGACNSVSPAALPTQVSAEKIPHLCHGLDTPDVISALVPGLPPCPLPLSIAVGSQCLPCLPSQDPWRDPKERCSLRSLAPSNPSRPIDA